LSLLVESHIFIDDSAASTIAEMRARARRLKQNAGGLDLIMIDYLQLMSASMPGASKRGFENRVQEVSAISRGLKAMAKELQVPVIALSQLSRSNEKRDDKRPMLSDLRESGSIEQDADVVAFIHREAYYNRDEDISAEEKAKSEIIIAKQRNGPTGIVRMHWNAAFTRFDGVDTHHEGD
jgi:replicative DNA helicase